METAAAGRRSVGPRATDRKGDRHMRDIRRKSMGDGPDGSSPIRAEGGQASTNLLSGDEQRQNLHLTFGNLFAFSAGEAFVNERLA